MFCISCCCRKEREGEEALASGRPTNEGQGSDVENQESEEERKRKISEALITKKVVESTGSIRGLSSLTSALSKSNRVYSSFAAALSKSQRSVKFSENVQDEGDVNGDSQRGDNDGLVEASTGDIPDKKDDESVEKLPTKRRRKCNIVARKISDSFRSHNSAGDQPIGCSICLMDYEVGEDVCWSRNPECIHAFHKECIVDWLMRNPQCPCCRRDYIYDGVTGE